MEDLLKKLFDEKTVKIVSYIQGKKNVQIRETARETNLPVATVFRIFKKLESIDLLKGMPVGSFKIYHVNKASKFYSLIEKIVPKMKPLEAFINDIPKDKIEQVQLLDEGEDKASILVIGSIKTAKVMETCEQVKQDFSNYSIKPLVLTRPQYENMASLNIAPVSKKSLFKK